MPIKEVYLESFLGVNFDFPEPTVSVADLEHAGVAAIPILGRVKLSSQITRNAILTIS